MLERRFRFQLLNWSETTMPSDRDSHWVCGLQPLNLKICRSLYLDLSQYVVNQLVFDMFRVFFQGCMMH